MPSRPPALPPSKALGAGVGDRSRFLLELLAGILGGMLIGLATLKTASIQEILHHPFRYGYLLAIFLEGSVGALLLFRKNGLLAWVAGSSLCGGLFLFAWIGPPLRDCLCLGFLGELGSRGRSSLAGALFALALAGASLTIRRSAKV